MKVAIVHYWLVSMRGGESVVEQLCMLFPEADIFTLICDETALSLRLRRHKITTSFLQKIPGAKRGYKRLLPLMPFALESFDLTPYDLVISSESGPAKGIVPRPDALHICYCHTPMRYIWDHYHSYRAQAGLVSRVLMPIISPFLRQWDVTTAARVDAFAANSRHVANRIERFYRRQAKIIHPPVAVEDFAPAPEIGDFYLYAGQLVGYKRPDLAVRVFSDLGKKLIVIGEGEELTGLKKIAGPTVTFLGRQPFANLKDHLARCRALIFPGEEDFGIVPVEAMASGRPVIAFNRGGARETILPDKTGLFFTEQSVKSLKKAVDRFERMEATFDTRFIQNHAKQFSSSAFREKMLSFIQNEIRDRDIPQSSLDEKLSTSNRMNVKKNRKPD